MAVDLGDAQVGVVIGVAVFDDVITEMFAVGALPATFTFERDVGVLGSVRVTVLFDVPSLVLGRRPGQDLRTELHLTGTIEVRPQGEPDTPPTLTLPLDIQVYLDAVLVPVAGAAPVLGLTYGGLAEPSGPFSESDVNDLFAEPAIADALAALQIDVLAPVIDGVGPILFPDIGDRPPDDGWSTGVTMLAAESPSELDAVGVFLAVPGGIATPVVTTSPLPALTGFGIVYNRSFLDLAFGQAAAAQEGEAIEGAIIERLSIEMLDTAVNVDGRATQGSATITFVGPIVPSLVPGTIVLHQDTSGVDVDVDVPWWQDVLLFFRFIPVFYPILIPAALLNPEWDVWAGAAEIAAAPGQVRSGLATAFAGSLTSLSQGLEVAAGVGSVSLEATPDSSRIENGHFLFFAQTFVRVLTEPIANAYFSRVLKRFVQYELASGRLFKASELARLVAIGKIVTPGFHQVRRKYMRADPDPRLANNLEESFGLNLATPPY